MLTHPQLMTRIEQYSFDNLAAGSPDFGFLDRLCVETGWPKSFAIGAIREYRRFVYLAVTSDAAVTPSREVDAVWHLHLTYTRSYWERLRAILPRDLHHEPTPGGQAAATLYREQYTATVARYRAEFDETPPDDYWPPADERFQPDMRAMRGVPRIETAPNKTRLGLAGAAAAAAAMAVTPAFAADGFPGETVTAVVVGIGAFLVILTIISAANSRPGAKKKKDKGDGGSTYAGGCGSSGKDGKDGGESGGGESGGDGGGGGCGGGGCGS